MAARVGTKGIAGSLGRTLIVEDDAIIALDMADALTDGGAEKVVICPSVTAALS